MRGKIKKASHHKVDDKQYWRSRHTAVGDLRASGLQSVGLKANKYIYQILEDQYQSLLKSLDMSKVNSILDCGYGDGYFLQFFVNQYPKKRIEGIDISPSAQAKIDFLPASALHVGDLATFNLSQQFDLVHCFDVLYHILDDKDYQKALINLAHHSSDLIALHERFLNRAPLVSSAHVRLRRREVTNQILNSQNFFMVAEIPTHFLAMRTLTFKLNKLMPKTLYKLDSFIANNWPPHLQERLASHWIRIYKKAA